MPAGVNVPVLIGAVPLFTVTSLTLNEGYQVARIAGSRLAQLVSPTARTIAIEAVLVGRGRLLVKKELEAMALTSRTMAAATAPRMKLAGVPVVCGMTISLDMQITGLRFTQSNQKRDALDVSIALEQVPRSSLSAIIGEALDMALAAGFAAVPSVSGMVPLQRQLGGAL
jgi:Na+/H+ antiporter NhaA